MSLELKKEKILVGVALTIFVAIGGIVGHMFYKYEVDWRSAYEGVNQFGEGCRGQVGDWDHADSFASIFAKHHSFSPMPMPHRGSKVSPRAYQNQYLIVECPVDLSALKKTGFAKINIWRSMTEAQVFLNGNLVAHTENKEIIEFWIPPADRTRDAIVTMISKGSERGSTGLNHLIPMIYSADEKELSITTFWVKSLTREVPAAMILFSAGLGIIFLFAWLIGLRFADLSWAIILLATFSTARLMEHEWLSNLVDMETSYRLIGATGIATHLALFAFSSQLLRLRSIRSYLPLGFVLLCACTAVLYSYVSSKTLYEYRMAYLLPSIIGITLMASTIGLGVFDFLKRSKSAKRQGRVVAFLATAVVSVLLLALECYFQEAHAIFVGRYIHLSIICLFAFFLTSDLVWYEKQAILKEKRQIEHAHRSTVVMATKSIQSIAHDVKRPFTFIKGLLEYIRSEKDAHLAASRVEQFYPELRASMVAVDSIISDALDLVGQQGKDAETVQLNDLIQRSLLEFQPVIARRRIELFALPAAMDGVLGHYGGLRRVLSNILENAIEATPDQGRITVGIAAGRTLGKTCLYVENSGSFVEEEDRERIFESFFTKGKKNGRGLGLAICRQIILDHGGSIWCTSTDRKSTTFFIELLNAKASDHDFLSVIGEAKHV